MHCIFNTSGNKWFCTAHTIFRIRWCWKQKNLKCCKISYFVYFKSFRKKLFCTLTIVGIFCHVAHKIYVVSLTQQLLGNERVGMHHQWNMVNVLFVHYPCNVGYIQKFRVTYIWVQILYKVWHGRIIVSKFVVSLANLFLAITEKINKNSISNLYWSFILIKGSW